MSRIGGPGDRPIATSEPTTEAQQTSETESIQKTDIGGKAPFDGEETSDYHTPSTEAKGQQYESRLGGLARQAELQSQLPIPSQSTLKGLPDRPNLDPNVHLDEKIDVTKNLPDGHAINSGLEGLDWGSSKEKTGPNHMGVSLTTGGMKAQTDRLDEVLNGGKLGQPNNSSSPTTGGSIIVSSAEKSVEGGDIKSTPGDSPGAQGSSEGKGGSQGTSGKGGSTPPPGVELNSRAPNSGLVSFDPAYEAGKVIAKGVRDVIQMTKDVASAPGEMYDSLMKGITEPTETPAPPAPEPWQDGAKKKMTDPDAGGGVPTSDEIAKILKGRLGQVEHGVNPDLGVGPVTYGELKNPIDLLSDPIDDGESTVETSSLEKAKLAADIHGPRTVNPDSGFGGVKPGGVKSGGDPSDQEDINKP